MENIFLWLIVSCGQHLFRYLVTLFRRLHHIHITVTSYERHGVSLRSHAWSHDRRRNFYQPITATSNAEMKTLVKLRRRFCSKTYEFLGFAEYFFLFSLDDSIKPLFYPMLFRHPHVLCHPLQYTPGIFYFFFQITHDRHPKLTR